jgi:hypothetical protein
VAVDPGRGSHTSTRSDLFSNKKELTMPRIIVVADTPHRARIDAPVLMDEDVKPAHLADEHASHQIVERVAWAVLDAQEISSDTERIPNT